MPQIQVNVGYHHGHIFDLLAAIFPGEYPEILAP